MYKEEQKIMRMTMPSTNMSMKMERKKEQKDENEENVKPLLQVGFCFLWWRKSSHFLCLSWGFDSSCQTYLNFTGGHQEHVEDGEESVQLLCCSFQKYLHCSESVVNTTCGYETARFTKSFLDRMSGPLIQVTILYFLPLSESYSEPYLISTLI